MRVVGVEPTRLAAQEPKSCASANSTIPAYSSILQLRPNRLNIVSVPAEKVNHCIDISALHSAYYRRTIVSFSMAERGFLPMRRSKLRRAGSIAATYLLVAALAVLGWLWHSLPAEILLEPGQTLTLPRFAYVQPLRTAGSRNAASTQAAGSYQATLSIGGWLPVKTVRALVETRPVVTVCGTPFGVKMFSEGALIVGFSDLNTPDGSANVKAFQSLAWPQEDLDTLMLQWSKVHEMPQVAGSYIVGREIENAYREVINNYYNARETLVEYCGNINDEINRKRKEFDLPTLDD